MACDSAAVLSAAAFETGRPAAELAAEKVEAVAVGPADVVAASAASDLPGMIQLYQASQMQNAMQAQG